MSRRGLPNGHAPDLARLGASLLINSVCGGGGGARARTAAVIARRAAPRPSGTRDGFEEDLLGYLEAVSLLGSTPPSGFALREPNGSKRTVRPSDAQAWVDACFEQSVEALSAYDYSSATARLVASVPARSEARGHCGSDLRRWGHPKVRAVLRAAAAAGGVDDAPSPTSGASSCSHAACLVMQFSSMSLGKNDAGWVRELAGSFCCTAPGAPLLPPLRLVFPTTEEVRDSLEGWAAGLSIPNNSADGARACIGALNELAARGGPSAQQEYARVGARAAFSAGDPRARTTLPAAAGPRQGWRSCSCAGCEIREQTMTARER